VVHRIDNVVRVKPLKSFYKPDIGDVVVGTVVQVQEKKWRVEIGSY